MASFGVELWRSAIASWREGDAIEVQNTFCCTCGHLKGAQAKVSYFSSVADRPAQDWMRVLLISVLDADGRERSTDFYKALVLDLFNGSLSKDLGEEAPCLILRSELHHMGRGVRILCDTLVKAPLVKEILKLVNKIGMAARLNLSPFPEMPLGIVIEGLSFGINAEAPGEVQGTTRVQLRFQFSEDHKNRSRLHPPCASCLQKNAIGNSFHYSSLTSDSLYSFRLVLLAEGVDNEKWKQQLKDYVLILLSGLSNGEYGICALC